MNGEQVASIASILSHVPEEKRTLVEEGIRNLLSGNPPSRHRLPDTRGSQTHKITLRTEQGELDMYTIVSFFPETADPAEVFVFVSKQGSTLQGAMNTVATTISLGLQYGIPWAVIFHKLAGHRFAPGDAIPVTRDGIGERQMVSLVDAMAHSVDHLIRRERSLLGFPEQVPN